MTIARRSILCGGGLIAVSALSGVLPARRAKAALQLRPATAAWGPAAAIYAGHMVAEVEGLFADEGLEVKHIMADGGAKARQMVAAGQSIFAQGDLAHSLQISVRGKPSKALMNTEIRAPFAYIVVRRDLYEQGIDTPEKLGRWAKPGGAKPVVATTAVGSGTWLFGTFIFEKAGVNDRINWVSGGNASSVLGGLASKQFDAIMAFPAWKEDAEAQGWGRMIYDVANKSEWDRVFGGNVPTTVVFALDTTIEREPELCQAYVNGNYRGMQWLRAHTPKEIYDRIGPAYFGDLSEASAIKEFAFAKEIWHYDGRISEVDYANGAQVWFRDNTDIPNVPFAKAVEPRFIAAAKAKYG
jgi:NitT/TauT family transport system substrate-binding protein